MEQTQNITLFAYILSIFTGIFLISLYRGIYLKLTSILFATLSYPTYLAMYSFEYAFYNNKNVIGKKVLRLNIPNKNPQRLIMNISATIATSFAIDTSFNIFNAFSHPEWQMNFVHKFIKGDLTNQYMVIISMISIVIIYCISYFCTENDERTAYDKIESLSIPSLWKKIIN